MQVPKKGFSKIGSIVTIILDISHQKFNMRLYAITIRREIQASLRLFTVLLAFRHNS